MADEERRRRQEGDQRRVHPTGGDSLEAMHGVNLAYGSMDESDPRWLHPAAENGDRRNYVVVPETRINDSSHVTVQMDDVIPTYKPKSVRTNSREPSHSVRRRRTGSRRRHEEDEDGGDIKLLPSTRIQRLQRTKSLKQRKEDWHDEHDGREPTLGEKFSDLRETDDINTNKLANFIRASKTSTKRKTEWKKPKKWARFKNRSKEVFLHYQLWIGTFRIVEGKFGTAIMCYFRFIRWLMFLNLYMALILICAIIIPYLALDPAEFVDSVPKNLSESSFLEQAVECSANYDNHSKFTFEQESTFETVLDFLQGTGWMERTVLFYGVYFNKTSPDLPGLKYDMSLAYMIAVGACFFISFVLVIKNSAKNVKVTLGVEQAVAKYNNKIFGGWDYCVRGYDYANLKKESIHKDITADLSEQRLQWQRENMTTRDKVKLCMIRVGINLFVMALLGSSLYLIVWTTETLLELQKQNLNEIVALIVQYLPYITISILNAAVPIIFQKLVPYEQYSHSFALKITIARAVLLRLASLMVLMGSLYKLLIVDVNPSAGLCGNNRWEEQKNVTSRGNIKCWETYVGQQLYKLVLLDLILETGIIFFFEFPRRIIHTKYSESSKVVKLFGPQEFDLPQSVIDITYSQTLCWLGMFFSPFIPLMTFIKCFIFFNVKKLTLLYNCCPQERPYRTSRSNSLFMLVLILSFILAAVPTGYMVGKIPPSQSCGPYRLYSNMDFVMFDTISNTVASWPDTASDIVYFFGTAGFLLPVLILLGILMYYYWVLGQGYKKTEKMLQEQLKLEAQDKKFLHGRVIEIMRHPDFAIAVSANS